MGNVSATIDERGYRTTFTYDALDRLTQTQNARGDLATAVYDAVGNVTASVDQLGRRTTFSYDVLDRLTQTQHADGGLATLIYDAGSNVTATVNPLGYRSSYTYDGDHQVLTAKDATKAVTSFAYDLAGNVTSVTNPRGYITTLTYDALDRRTQTQDALGNLATVVFDAAGNVLATVDERANRTSFAYDGLNQLTSQTDPLSHTNTLVYDLAGNVIRRIDPAGYTTTYAFDGLNRMTSTQAADGGIATTVYDAAGNVTTWIDPLGQRTTYVYDAIDRMTQSTDARGGLTTTIYDAVGNTVNLIDAKNNTTTFAYDVMDRLTKQTDPLGHSGTFAYDLEGRLTSATDRNGNRRDLRYDGVDRETGETWIAGGSTANLLTYSYDANGNLLTAANYNGAYTLTYDALDRTSAVQEPFGQALTYQYDAASNRTQVQDSQGGVTTSVYDAADRLTTREQTNGLAPVRVDYTYTVRDQVAGVTRWADLVQIVKVGSSSYSYDAVGRMTNVRHQNSAGTNLANLTYTYDLDGRVTSEKTNGALKSFTYDATNQLTNDAVKTYTYDATGNRTMTGYQTGTGNQLKNDGVYTYTYDAEGNLTKKSKGTNGDTWTYGYDNANHLIWVKDAATDGGSATMLATYVYDALGNRIEKDVWQGGVTTVTRFAYDGTEVWADLNSSNQLQTRYVWGDDGGPPLARVSAGTAAVAWYLPDQEGSVRNLTDNSGVLQDTITYDGFGNVASESSASFSDRYKYAGGEYDKETGLQHDGARYYDPATGRWLQQDPIGFTAGDPNLYRFVGNDPTNVIDPSGLDGTVSSGAGGGGFNWYPSDVTPIGTGDGSWMDPGYWQYAPPSPFVDPGFWAGPSDAQWTSADVVGAARGLLDAVRGILGVGGGTGLPDWSQGPVLSGGGSSDAGWMVLPYIPGQGDSGAWSTLPYVPGQDNGSWVALADGGWQTLPYIPGQDSGSWSTLPYVPGQDNGSWVALADGGWQTLPYIPGQDSGSWSTLPYVPGQHASSSIALSDFAGPIFVQGGSSDLGIYVLGAPPAPSTALPYIVGRDDPGQYVAYASVVTQESGGITRLYEKKRSWSPFGAADYRLIGHVDPRDPKRVIRDGIPGSVDRETVEKAAESGDVEDWDHWFLDQVSDKRSPHERRDLEQDPPLDNKPSRLWEMEANLQEAKDAAVRSVGIGIMVAFDLFGGPEERVAAWLLKRGFKLIGRGARRCLVRCTREGRIIEGRIAKEEAEQLAREWRHNKAAKSFKSFDALKRELGPAGEGKVWHHIVEQRLEGRFGAEAIHNTSNVVAISREANQAIANYYSSIRRFTGGKTVREWLETQSFAEQDAFGRRILDAVLNNRPLPP
jgi:RHS repeat-associated protein